MAKMWRIVAVTAATLLVAGILLAGTGFLTGGSVARVSAVLSSELESLDGIYRQLYDAVSELFHFFHFQLL